MAGIADLKPEDLEKLTTFVSACQAKPELLQLPQLAFFRDYLQNLGAKIPKLSSPSTTPPPTKSSPTPEPKAGSPKDEEAEEEELIESDIELNNEGVIEPETEEPPELGDGSKEVLEDDMDAANDKRSEAMCAMSDGDFEKSVGLFTEAIKLNPGSAMLYAKRANVLLKQKRVKAAIRDCDEALRQNPDSAVAYKYRGRAHRLLGNWLEAAKDLRLACKLDFDEQSDEWLKEVLPNASKIEEHNRKYDRLRKDKEIREKKENVRKAKEAAKKAQEEQKKQGFSEGMSGGFPGFPGFPGGFPGGMPGFMSGGMPGGMPGGMSGGMPGGMSGGMPGGMPGGMSGGASDVPGGASKPDSMPGASKPDSMPGGSKPDSMPGASKTDKPFTMPGFLPEEEEPFIAPGGKKADFAKLFRDPEVLEAMQDPEVTAAFQDVSLNPGNIFKYQSNPKIAGIMTKVMDQISGDNVAPDDRADYLRGDAGRRRKNEQDGPGDDSTLDWGID